MKMLGLSAALLMIVAALSSRDASADTYPATYVYGVDYGSTCQASVNTTFPSGLSAATACFQEWGSAACDWYYQLTMSHEWPEPQNEVGMRVYTTPCGGNPPTTTYAAWLGRNLSCPGGGLLSGTQCVDAPPCGVGITRDSDGQCFRKPPCPQNCPPQEGNPIQVALGNKVQVETDYVAGGAFPIKFERFYNSVAVPVGSSLKHQWRHTFDRRLQPRSGETPEVVNAIRDSGEIVRFSASGGSWVADGDMTDRLVKLVDGWQYTVAADNSVERYNAGGTLLSITYRNGLVQQFTYAFSIFAWYPSTAPACTNGSAAQGQLGCVTDSLGRQLNLKYDGAARLVRLIDFAGGETIYYYDGNWDLGWVGYPDGKYKTYHYNESANTSGVNNPNALTGISGEDLVRYATFKYDTQGRAISTEHAGGAEKVSMSYGSGSTTFTDALGTARTYTFQTILGTALPVSLSQPCAHCSYPFASTSYDANGNPSSRTDFNGGVTHYTYDLSRNLETSRTEAYGTPRARTIATQWHSTYRMPTQIDEPGRRTTFTHDANGNVLTKTLLDTTTSQSRTWTYTYNASDQVLTANGPRTDVTDVTTYAYYGTAATCTATVAGASTIGCRGQVQTITNALGHVTTFNEYDAHGQALKITDPNGVVTTLSYDLRLRLTSRSVGSEQTTFTYWPTGLLKRATLPDGSYLEYTYDAAHRLTQIADSEGNRIVYTLDAMGNRTAEQLYDPSSALTQTRTRVFNTLNQLWKEIGAAGTSAVTTTFGYDNNGNQTGINAPLSRNTSQAYDELNRLTQVTDPLSGATQYGYNALDQLISVTDPRSKVTSYTYNALGDLTQQVSPDTGTTTNTYDSGGNLATSTDARSKTATYAYDALNRVTSLTYPDQTLSYTYDSGTNQKGRLTQVTDASGSTSWTYDTHGRVLSRQQSMGITKTVGYAYDSEGRLQTLTLPSGNTITYAYSDGKIASLTLNGSTTILSNVLYQPFGPTRGWTWGNSTLAIREYDTDGKITDIDSAGLKSYSYDDAFRITGITDAANSTLSQSYGYDLLDRLTSATGTSLSQGWTYDANGNRLSQTGSAASTYTVSSTSNRLSSVTGALTRSYSYDSAGNTTADGAATFGYNYAGRMVSATKASVTTSYALNALGQRVKKTTSGSLTYFAYDEAGHLIGEYNNAGNLIQETVWFGDTPVATLRPNGSGVDVFYVHADHLNTPRRISRPSDNAIVWRWDSDPFGTTLANEDPDGDSSLFAYNLRFPGQYFDVETGLHYNYFRDCFDPATGRYCQPDPMGVGEHAWTESIAPALMKNHGRASARAPLELNPYAYVVNNPVSRTDPTGADETDGGKGSGGDDGGGLKCPLVGQFTMFVYTKFHPLPVKWVMCIYDCNTTCPGSLGNIKMVPTLLFNPPYTCYPTYTRRLGD